MPTPVTTFVSAARAFGALVHEIPDEKWTGPGLGDWDLRSLVGHTARALVTVETYLPVTADHEDIANAAAYFARLRAAADTVDHAAVAERGRQAGRDLGARPAEAIDALVARVTRLVSDSDDPLISVIGGLGIRLHAYLPTRTFELTVHSLDIASTLDMPFVPSADVLAQTVTLAALIAAAAGEGESLLRALTGRGTLPSGFSVV